MKISDPKVVAQIETLQAQIIKLQRKNNELMEIATQATNSLKEQTNTIDKLIKDRDSFMQLAKNYAEELGYNTFNKA